MNSRNQSSHHISQLLQNTGLNFTCKKHDNEPITNICISARCFEPLCPECIYFHSE